MGGYLAPRAVAYEKRITAVIANSLIPDCKTVLLTGMGFDASKPFATISANSRHRAAQKKWQYD
jgi:hypothetical protein